MVCVCLGIRRVSRYPFVPCVCSELRCGQQTQQLWPTPFRFRARSTSRWSLNTNTHVETQTSHGSAILGHNPQWSRSTLIHAPFRRRVFSSGLVSSKAETRPHARGHGTRDVEACPAAWIMAAKPRYEPKGRSVTRDKSSRGLGESTTLEMGRQAKQPQGLDYARCMKTHASPVLKEPLDLKYNGKTARRREWFK